VLRQPVEHESISYDLFYNLSVAAKATKCLADSSEVVVETGPFFGGRISVEDSTIPGCFVKGNSQRYVDNVETIIY
jgi:hypothetical protein